MIAVTGASGKLGRHVIGGLLRKIGAKNIVAVVRDASKAADYAAAGIDVRVANYDASESLVAALRGVDKLLLISGNEFGKRAQQHRAIVAAAKQMGVKHVVYTSILRADTAHVSIAEEHRLSEKAIRESGVPFTFLRNGWYFENYTENLGPALEYGALHGSAQSGRIAAATRLDFADAAVAVITSDGHEGKTYELAGDEGFTMSELAAEVARQAKKPVAYNDLPSAKYKELLAGFGLPEPVVTMLVTADEGIARGELDRAGGDLRRLIGRPTGKLSVAVGDAVT